MSCLLFLMRSRSALRSSSMLSLMRLASASRWRRAMRSCSVSDAGGRRSWEKGSPSVLVLCTDGGLEAVSMAGSPRRMEGSVEERTGVGALASAAGERREEKGAEG